MRYKLQQLPTLENIEKIFFIGVKGVGMTPLAIIASQANVIVAGSDTVEEFITDKYLLKSNIQIFKNFETLDIERFFKGTDIINCLVVTTGAHKGYDNPQSLWAKENGIPVISQGQALSLWMDGDIFGRDNLGIAVTGSHGKTTTSSMLTSALQSLGCDPSYSVGTGELYPTGAPGHFGTGDYFVAEADEYASEPVYDRVPKFLYLNPKYAIINNIDFDHPDMFVSIEDIENAFLEFVYSVKSGGILILNGDDKRLLKIKEKITKDIRIITVGSNKDNDYQISKIVSSGLGSIFTVFRKDKELGVFEVSVPGRYNCQNAVGVIALLSELNFKPLDIRSSLKKFTGSKRRLEKIGLTRSGSEIFDDYGHHPVEIRVTLEALKKAYPQKQLVCIFQPHTFSRTKSLLAEFSKAFDMADQLILLPVFKSARDTEKDILSEEKYLEAFTHKGLKFFEKFEDVVQYLDLNCASNDFVLITMGAGDVYKIGEMLKT